MGNCKYCGNKAGVLRNKHKTCAQLYIDGKKLFNQKVKSAIRNNEDLSALEETLYDLEDSHFLENGRDEMLLLKAYDQMVEEYFEDGILSEDEEDSLNRFTKHFELGQDVLDINKSKERVTKGIVLREILEGKIPDNILNVQGGHPFLFQKSEKVIWFFQNVDFYEQRTRTEYRGGSHGVSVRIAKGVYYRTSSYKGKPVQISEMKFIGSGTLALTSKHIYFTCPGKTFKIPFKKIVGLNPYTDGLGVQKDGVTAKPQVFKGLDGWFIHNAISNLIEI